MLTFSWGSFALAVLKALPTFISLVAQIKTSADAKANRGIGYDQAVSDGIVLARQQLADADQAVAEAKASHAAHPNSDEGRDIQFRRD